jgi:integrase
MQAYGIALAGGAEPLEIGAGRIQPGTVSASISGYLSSLEFVSLGSEATKRTYRRGLEKIRREHGNKPMRLLEAPHIKAIMAQKIATPAAANNFLRYLKLIIPYALEKKWIREDPTARIKKISYDTEGWHTWTEDEIDQYEKFWPRGTMQRTAFDLLLFTGQRSADVRQMKPAAITPYGVNVVAQFVDGVDVKQQKTKGHLTVPITDEIKKSLSTIQPDAKFLVETSFGKPFTEKGFSNTKGELSWANPRGFAKFSQKNISDYRTL